MAGGSLFSLSAAKQHVFQIIPLSYLVKNMGLNRRSHLPVLYLYQCFYLFFPAFEIAAKYPLPKTWLLDLPDHRFFAFCHHRLLQYKSRFMDAL